MIQEKKSRGLADELEDIQLKISVRDRLIRINNSLKSII